VETEEEVDKDHKDPHILRSEVDKAIKETRDTKVTGDDDVPMEALKLLGDDGLNLLTQLVNDIYESGEWPKDFTEVTVVTLKKKPKARKYTDHRTSSLIAHAVKVVASVEEDLRRKLRMYLGKINLDLEKEKELEMQLEF
jgi:hypothetical protein